MQFYCISQYIYTCFISFFHLVRGMNIQMIEKAISSSNGRAISKYFEIPYLLNEKGSCEKLLKSTNSIKIQGPWKEIFSLLFKIPKESSSKSVMKLFDQASNLFLKSLSKFDNELRIHIFKSIILSYKYLSNTELEASVQKLRHLLIYENSIKGCNSVDGSPLLYLANCLLSLFISFNDYNQASKILDKCIDSVTEQEKVNGVFTVSERAQFYFIAGKIHTVNSNFNIALEYLTKAWKLTPLSAYQDRRLILTVLIPVQLSFGMIPSDKLLEKYNLVGLYGLIIESIISADLNQFDKAFQERSLIFIRLGVWDVISKTKLIIYRRFLEIICVPGSKILTLESFHKAICAVEKISIDEAEVILSNLISKKYFHATISDVQQKFVLKPEGALPPYPLK